MIGGFVDGKDGIRGYLIQSVIAHWNRTTIVHGWKLQLSLTRKLRNLTFIGNAQTPSV